MNIAIIGGGNGGTTILRAFSGIKEFKILGICDVNYEAPGIKLAKELGVPVFNDLQSSGNDTTTWFGNSY